MFYPSMSPISLLNLMRQSLQINTLWETEIMCERGCEAEASYEAKVAVEAVLVHYTYIHIFVFC